jgi:hypothetical protein
VEDLRRDEHLFAWMDERRESASGVKGQLEREFGLVMSYYEGHGWTRIAGSQGTRLQQLQQDQNPDSPVFRVGLNRSSKLVQRAAAATQPVNVNVDVFPPDRETGPESAFRSQVYEDTINEYIELSNFVSRWQDANFGRSVCGTYGFGFCLYPTRTKLKYAEQAFSAQDCQIEAFSFLPIKLTLDPRLEERDLQRHDEVVYTDVWSLTKIKRVYGELLKARRINLDDLQAHTFGELATFELSVNALTNNRLFAQYRNDSKTPAAFIHQVHRKSPEGAGYGRFDKYDIVLEMAQGKKIRLTEPEMETPFGGCGMPMVLLHGHRRGDSMWSIGDQKMLVDDQDRLNRLQLYTERQLIQNSSYKLAIDMRTMGRDKTPEQLRKRVNNAIGAPLFYESGSGSDKGNPPFVMQMPQPQSFLRDLIAQYEMGMREQVHRAEGHMGSTKSHVPDATFQRALDEAGQVLDMRVAEDKATMQQALTVLLGTACGLVAQQSPGTLGLLVRRGFTPEELATLADTDWTNPPCTIRVRDSSIRLRSYTARKQDLDTAAQLQQIDPASYRRELAGMDTPLTRDDKFYEEAFARYARVVMNGEEWTPMPLGERTPDLVEAFRKAMLDRRADKEAQDRLARAITSQQMMVAQEQALLQPVSGATLGTQQEADPTEQAFGQMVDQLSAQVAA